MATRSMPAQPWAAPFEVLIDHLTTLPSPNGGRFARREAAVAEPAWPAQEQGWTGQAGPPAAPQGRPLPSDVLTRLRAVVGPGVEAMRVHDDDAAHETAEAHRADAVTVGSDVYFRRGKLNPREPRGFGLLVHEATHVVERSRRADTAGAAGAEENLALTREAAVVSGRSPAPGAWQPPPHRGDVLGLPPGPAHIHGGPAAVSPAAFTSAPPPAALPAGPVATPAARPMTAAIDRPADLPPAAQQPFDVDALRERIVRDLKRQLRDEYERGG